MTDSTAVTDLVVPAPHKSRLGKLRALFVRSEPLRGYTLLSPTLIVMTFSMCVPFGIMVLVRRRKN